MSRRSTGSCTRANAFPEGGPHILLFLVQHQIHSLGSYIRKVNVLQCTWWHMSTTSRSVSIRSNRALPAVIWKNILHRANYLTMLNFFDHVQYFLNAFKFFWPRSKVIFYLLHLQNFLNVAKNIWTWSKNIWMWSKNIWTSRWNRHQRELLNFENWVNGEVSKSAKSPNLLTFKVNFQRQKSSESF